MGSLRRASRSLHDHRIVALAVLVGALTGLSVAAFERVVRGGIIDRLLDAPLAVQVVTPVLGFAIAALTAFTATVINAINSPNTPATANTHHPISTR